jgi:CRP-like cAMP-binding protein
LERGELAERVAGGHRGDHQFPVAPPITHDELAMWVGSTREAASRSHTQLRATGAVASSRGTITVVDLIALQAHARTITA